MHPHTSLDLGNRIERFVVIAETAACCKTEIKYYCIYFLFSIYIIF